MNDGARLQLLTLQEVGDCNGIFLGRARLQWLLSLLLLHLLGAHLILLLLHGLLSESGYVFRYCHSVLLGLYGKLALDLLNLFGRGLLAWGWHALRRPLWRCFSTHRWMILAGGVKDAAYDE